MTDARFPERWLTDRRVLRLSDSAFRGFVNGLAYSVSNRTEGVIEPDDLPLIPNWVHGTENDLAKSELWVELTYGWLIDGFAITQTGRQQLEANDKQRANAAERKRQQRERDRIERDRLASAAEAIAGQRHVTGDVTGDVSQGTSPVTSQARTGQARPVLSLDVTEEQKCPTPTLKGAVVSKPGTSLGETPKTKRRSPNRTQIPDDWQPPTDARKRMRETYPHLDLSAERQAFVNHHQAHGNNMADWTKAFWTWLGNTRKFGNNGGTVNGRPVIASNDDKALEWMALGRQPDTTRRELE